MNMSFKEAYNKVLDEKSIYQKKPNKIKLFFEALDLCFEGNKIYEFYYYHIWLNIWKIFYDYPKRFINWIHHSYYRIKNGISYQDVWGFNDYLIQVMYYGIKEFIKQEWGETPELKTDEEWENGCQTHNKEMYNTLSKYVSLYNRLQSLIIKQNEIIERDKETLKDWKDDSKWEEVRKLEEEEWNTRVELYKLFSKISEFYMENLWT